MRRRASGFTLIELLVAAALGLFVLGALGQFLTTSLRVKQREDQIVPLQQTLRASAEAISQDMREAIGSRVVYTGSLPSGMTLPVSGASQVTLLVPVQGTSFAVRKPPGYPNPSALNSCSYNLYLIYCQYYNVTDNVTTQTYGKPAAQQVTCAQVFSTGDYGIWGYLDFANLKKRHDN